MGLVGLTKSVAIEGKKNNICCNAIAPLATSRMTEKIFPAVMLEKMDPKFVAPLVLFLCHESCNETGAVFEVSAGWAAKIQTESAAVSLVHLKLFLFFLKFKIFLLLRVMFTLL